MVATVRALIFATAVTGAMRRQHRLHRPSRRPLGPISPAVGRARQRPAPTAPGPTPAGGRTLRSNRAGTELTVRPGAAQPQRYKTDGTDSGRALERAVRQKESCDQDGCHRRQRDDHNLDCGATDCPHGEVAPPSDEPEPTRSTIASYPTTIRPHSGRRTLESITVVDRNGDRLNVESTRSVPGGSPTTTRTEYTKRRLRGPTVRVPRSCPGPGPRVT